MERDVDRKNMKKSMKKSMKKATGRKGKVTRAVAASAFDVSVLPKPLGCPKAPTAGNPTDYNSGRIYLGRQGAYFRVIRVRGQYATEKPIKISNYETREQAWYHALKTITDYDHPGVDVN